MRGWEEPVNIEVAGQVLPEIVQWLDIAEGPVYVRIAMTKIPVRHDESAVLVQEPRYLRKFLRLEVSYILEDALGGDDVEALVTEPDRRVKEVSLDQVRRRVMYGNVNTVVVYIRRKQSREGCRPAANVKQRALFTARDPGNNSRGLLMTIMRLAEV
jgi:hypothetical protein